MKVASAVYGEKSGLMQRPRLLFSLMVLCFWVLHAWTLLTAVESVSWAEELHRGTLGMELLQGLKRPFLYYQTDRASGGSLMIGLLAAFFFALLGPHLIALKLAAVLFSFAAFLLLFYFMRRFFGERPALTSIFLYLLMPPAYVQVSFLAMGYHNQSTVPSMAMLYAFYRYLFLNQNRLSLIVFGLLAGFSLSFTLITGVLTLTCLLSWFWLSRRSFLSAHFWIFTLAFAVGALPFIAYNLSHGHDGINFMVDIFFRDQGFQFLGLEAAAAFIHKGWKAVEILFVKIPLSFCFPDLGRIPGELIGYLYFVLMGGLLIQVRRIYLNQSPRFVRVHNEPEVSLDSFRPMLFPMILYLFVFVFLLTLSSVEVSHGNFEHSRYFFPLYYFLLPLIALALVSTKRKGIYFAGLILFALLGRTGLVFQDPFASGLRYQGYSYTQLGARWAEEKWYSLPARYGEFRRFLSQFSDPHRTFLFKGYLSETIFPLEGLDDGSLKAIWDETPSEERFYLARAIGYSLGSLEARNFETLQNLLVSMKPTEKAELFRSYFEANDGLPEDEEVLNRMDSQYHSWFYFYLGRMSYLYPEGRLREKALQRANALQRNEKRWFYRGVGSGISLYWIYEDRDWFKAQARFKGFLPEENYEDLFWGAGWTVKREGEEDIARALDWLGKLPRAQIHHARQGFEQAEE